MNYKFNTNAPFFQLFESGMNTSVGSTRGTAPVNTAMVKLTFTISAMRAYVKCGLIPHRGFRLKDVKEFYGIKGNKQHILDALLHLRETMKNYEVLKSEVEQ